MPTPRPRDFKDLRGGAGLFNALFTRVAQPLDNLLNPGGGLYKRYKRYKRLSNSALLGVRRLGGLALGRIVLRAVPRLRTHRQGGFPGGTVEG